MLFCPSSQNFTIHRPPQAPDELHYLHEIGRLTPAPEEILRALGITLSLKVSTAGFDAIAVEAAKLTWTRDPFDRLICATARVAGARLLTKDGVILTHEPAAIWDQAPASA